MAAAPRKTTAPAADAKAPAAKTPRPKAAAKRSSAKTATGSAGSIVNADTPALEWIAAGVGLVLAAATVVLIGLEGLRGAPTPAAVTVAVTEVRKTPTGWLARIRATNAGGSPAAGVAIEGVLTRPGGASETAEAAIDFLPARSDRGGGLFFTADPRSGALALRAKGYTDP